MKSKGLFTSLVLLAALLLAIPLTAQQYGATAWAINNQRVASQFNYDVDGSLQSGLGAYVFPQSVCLNAINASGRQINPFNTNATIKIVDQITANTETVALTSITIANGYCTLVPNTATAHSSYHIRSGTCGLREALNDLKGAGGEVIVDQKFYDDGCSASTITGLTLASGLQANQYIHDISSGQDIWYVLKPTTLTLIAAGAAPTNTTITGSMSNGQYYTTYAYVDPVGGISLSATESAQTAATTGISIAKPAASTGAVGWIPYVTAAGGGSGTEIMVPVTSTICTLSTKVVAIPACDMNSAATIKANPTGTSKIPSQGTAHTTFAYQPLFGVPSYTSAGSFQTRFGPFTAVATINAAANADLAQFMVPAGFFNHLGKTVDICFKVNYSITATGVPTFKINASNNYGQSPVTLVTYLLPTQTGASTGTSCTTLVTAAVGSSGTFWVNGNFSQMLNSTQVGSTVGDVTTAVSSALDLTKPIYFSVNVGATTASVTSATVNSLSFRPVPQQ